MKEYSPQEAAEILYQLSKELPNVCERITGWPYEDIKYLWKLDEPLTDNPCCDCKDQVQAQADALCKHGMDYETIYQEILSIHLERLAEYIPKRRIAPVPYAILVGRKQRVRGREPKPFDFDTLAGYYLDMLELEGEALLPASKRRPAPKTRIRKSANFVLVELPPELREYEASLRQYPEFRIRACETENDALELMKQDPPDGGIYYAGSLEKAVLFLRKASDALNVPLKQIPRFLILLDNPGDNDRHIVLHMYGYPWNTASLSPDAVAWFFCHEFFDIKDGCFSETAPVNDENRGAALLYRLAFTGWEPAGDSKDLLMKTALRAYAMKDSYAIWMNAVKAAVAEVGMGWRDFWIKCYPGLADAEDYPEYIELLCGQMEIGFCITDWTVREKAEPCSDEMRALIERVNASNVSREL